MALPLLPSLLVVEIATCRARLLAALCGFAALFCVHLADAKRAVHSGVHINELKQTLRSLTAASRLSSLGHKGPPMASGGRRSLFNALFGRDAIRMSTDLIDDFPSVAKSTILSLASLQGTRSVRRSEEERGRIPHEARRPGDPIARRLSKEGWSLPYYGAADATPQWITLVGAYVKRNGPSILGQRLRDRSGRSITVGQAVERATKWVVGRIDGPQSGGLLWVKRRNPKGIGNQVWEDSPDSFYNASGALVDFRRAHAPVALQGNAYDALLTAAELSRFVPTLDAARLRTRAATLRRRVLKDYWQPDLGTFALGLATNPQGALLPLRVVSSDPGHLLASHLLDGADARPMVHKLVQRLMQPDLLAGAGLRTRSTSSPRFGAGTYHNGSVWPWDTGLTAEGMRRHGFDREANDLEDRLIRAVAKSGRFPEFFRGDVDGAIRINRRIVDRVIDGKSNRLEQPPQMSQGWTATRVWKILRARNVVHPPKGSTHPVGRTLDWLEVQ